jgi:hypothetical protein
VDAEQSGECHGRELGGEVHEGGVAAEAAVDAQAREAYLELAGGERMTGAPPGKTLGWSWVRATAARPCVRLRSWRASSPRGAEQAADQCPPVVIFDLGEQLVAGVLGNVQVVGVAASAGPEHEGTSVVVGARSAGEPGADVVLGSGRQALVVFS